MAAGKLSRGWGVQFEILKKYAPLISKPGSATAVCYTNRHPPPNLPATTTPPSFIPAYGPVFCYAYSAYIYLTERSSKLGLNCFQCIHVAYTYIMCICHYEGLNGGPKFLIH